MAEKKKLVVVVTNGFNDERSSVAWSVANGAIGSDMQVTMFLVSSGVDWVRKGAADQAHLNPLDDIAKQLEKLAKAEKLAQQLEQAGIKKEDLIDGVTLAGSVAMLDEVQQGASTLTF